ncbi:Protein of unknown function [Mycobacterium canettii CIPT 140070008]|nr:Protein of unknown function [Mycobacterium canettii CIPT 140070008]
MRHFLRLTFAGRFEGSRDDRPLLGYDTPTGLTCPYTTPLDVTAKKRALLTDLWVVVSAWQGGAVAGEGEHG